MVSCVTGKGSMKEVIGREKNFITQYQISVVLECTTEKNLKMIWLAKILLGKYDKAVKHSIKEENTPSRIGVDIEMHNSSSIGAIYTS
jgi:hypothetical protein